MKFKKVTHSTNKKLNGIKSTFISMAMFLLAVFIAQPAFAEELTKLLPLNAQWSYWYGDTSKPMPKAGWETEKFDSKSWAKAKGPLGYGAKSKIPNIPYSPITPNDKCPYSTENGDVESLKVPATFYRTQIIIEDFSKIKQISGIAHYDDAAIIYVNGIERLRLGNFSDELSKAAKICGGDATGATKQGDPVINQAFQMKASWFKKGNNIIAVAVLQDTGSSSDCVMGLELTASDTLVLANPDRINVTFYGDPTTQKSITWISDGNATEGKIQYVKANGKKSEVNWNEAQTVLATRTDYGEYSNKVLLKNLLPDTQYYFRVGGDDVWSEVGSFKTAEKSDGKFSFMHITDQQGSSQKDFDVWAKNIKGAVNKFDSIEFMVNTGDFVNDGLSEAEWKMCFNTASDTLMNTTLMPVVGNHEGYDYAGSFTKHFNLETTKQAVSEKGSYYSLDYENVHFVVLNTDEKENEDLSKAQLKWLEKDLKKASKNKSIQWIIVALHRSLYSSGDHSTDGDVINFRSSIGTLLDKYKVDIVLSGHDHVYMRTRPIYNQIAQNPKTQKIGNIVYDVNPVGTTHIIPATISTKNYELNKMADYRILQPALVSGEKYANGRDKFVSYSFLSESPYYPAKTASGSSAFVKVDVDGNKITLSSYAVKDGVVAAEPFDTYGIIKDSSGKAAIKTNKEEIKVLNQEDYPYKGASGKFIKDTNEYEDTIYDAEAYFKQNSGKQGDMWFYYYEESNKLKELVPLKGTKKVDGTTGKAIPTDCLYTQHPDATNIGNDSVQNGSVRLYDGVHDGNPRPDGERMTMVPYSDAKNEEGKDDIVVAWKAPKSGYIKISDWNPEFVGIVPAEKYLNTYEGFWVDVRLKKGSTGNPTEAQDYKKDSKSLLTYKSFPKDGDGIVSGGQPVLIDKGGPFDGEYTSGAFVQVNDLVKVEEGDYIYFISHCGNNYGWRGVILNVTIKYKK